MRRIIIRQNSIRWCIACLLLVVPTFLFAAGDKGKKLAFARVLCERDAMVEGDSCLVNVVVFSTYPFGMSEHQKPLKVKNGRIRRLPMSRQHLQRVLEDGKVYYAKVVEQYVLKTEQVGEATMPEREMKIVMEVPVRSADPLEEMFGISVPTKRVEYKLNCDEFRLKIKEKPKRTMMEMYNSGLQVI